MTLDDDWPVVMGKMRKVSKSWARFLRILGKEGGNPWVSGMFFKVVTRVLLILGSEMWIMTPCMGRSLGGGFTIGWTDGLQGGNPGGFYMEVGSTPHRRWKFRRQGLSSCRRMY